MLRAIEIIHCRVLPKHRTDVYSKSPFGISDTPPKLLRSSRDQTGAYPDRREAPQTQVAIFHKVSFPFDTLALTGLCPGIIDTPRPQGTNRQELSSEAIKRIALGRAGRADEVASVALFLASDAASFISGAIIDVNGGE